ncbi:hypothetical protein CPB84DRAFT_567832 [Gymnopilus junonius]|uniref:Uncharacterized protein n=1 Tax=Gymnopilus junonius TaxID=109634 RepID=A0A9P5NT66_GYMJU|nr:hypothetical protein CPB84DRAFT_567832 [Gymnopilus junonius]
MESQSMNTTTFVATRLWAEVQTLSLDDVSLYIQDPHLLRQKGKIASILQNTSDGPGSHDLEPMEAILLLHRYSLLHSDRDIVQGTHLVLNSVQLADEPHYAYFFFLLASHSWDLFERTTQIQHLESAIELLGQLRSLREQEFRSDVYAMISLVYASASMQYYLTEGEIQAREAASKALTVARQNLSGLKWMFSPRTRTLIVVADVVRYRYMTFGQQEELDAESLDTIRLILDTTLAIRGIQGGRS